MGPVWMVRARWRIRGAWMWPMFVVLGILDGVIAHLIPVAGDTQTVLGGVVLGLLFNLLAVVLVAPVAARLIRLARPDLPMLIAANYGGTVAMALICAGFVAAGLSHQSAINADQASLRAAVVRAVAYIDHHAPPPFAAGADQHNDTYVIQARSIYRTCVTNPAGTRNWCVIVHERVPAGRSVAPAGTESNATFARGLD